MKKIQIVMAAVPIACAVGGFGAGQLLPGSSAHASTAAQHQPVPEPKNAAEAVLHALAEQQAHASDPAPAVVEQHSSLTLKDMLHPASYTAEDEAPVLPQMHRIDYDKLAKMERRAALEAAQEQARQEQEQRIAELMENPRAQKTAHPSLLPLETEAKIAGDAVKLIAETDEHVVKLGRLTIPVEGAAAVTYFVADFAVSVIDLDQAKFYYEGENAARVRDQIVMTMNHIAETQLMRGSDVDDMIVAERVAEDLRAKFFGVKDFIFLSLYRTDVPRA